MTKRIKHIDIGKGISIVLVALNHSGVKEYFPEIMHAMGLFRMPLFFFLSGIFFSYLATPRAFLLKKSEALLKPYFFVLVLIYIISTMFTNENTLWQLRGMLYGTGETIIWSAMWFLPHLFIVYCFSYILFGFVGFNRLTVSMKWIYLFIFMLIGSLTIKLFWNLDISILGNSIILQGLPFSADIVLVTSVFFISGHLLKKKIINFSPSVFLFFISLCSFFCIVIYTSSHINFYNRIYERPLLSTFSAFCGIYMVMCISYTLMYMKYTKYMFMKFGEASLYILIFHMFIGEQISHILKQYSEAQIGSLEIAIISFLFSIFLPLLIKLVVSHNNVLALFFLPISTNKLLTKKSR